MYLGLAHGHWQQVGEGWGETGPGWRGSMGKKKGEIVILSTVRIKIQALVLNLCRAEGDRVSTRTYLHTQRWVSGNLPSVQWIRQMPKQFQNLILKQKRAIGHLSSTLDSNPLLFVIVDIFFLLTIWRLTLVNEVIQISSIHFHDT